MLNGVNKEVISFLFKEKFCCIILFDKFLHSILFAVNVQKPKNLKIKNPKSNIILLKNELAFIKIDQSDYNGLLNYY